MPNNPEDDQDNEDIADSPNESADPREVLERLIPADIFNNYELHSYKNAAVILSQTRTEEFTDILEALRTFRLTTQMIRIPGGNESLIPKAFSESLRPSGWNETSVYGDHIVTKEWKHRVGEKAGGKPIFQKNKESVTRERYLDGHKIDYVKGRVAFDLEWNSKDQTFDRDLYAFASFYQCGVIDAAILVTRSQSLNPVFEALGPALKKDGREYDPQNEKVQLTKQKYGASTTWMGKLLYRLNAGRNGGCPVLVVGITPKQIEDWPNEN